MQRLVLDGAPIDGEDAEGCTALHHAVKSVQLWACEILLQNGADVNYEDYEGNTPLHKCACWIGRDPDLEIVSLLVQNGADVCCQVLPCNAARAAEAGPCSLQCPHTLTACVPRMGFPGPSHYRLTLHESPAGAISSCARLAQVLACQQPLCRAPA